MSGLFLGEHYLLAKKETTPYTEEAPAGANAMEVYDLQIQPLTGAAQDRSNVARGFHGAGENIRLERYSNISFKVAVSTATGAGVAPAFGELLQACFCSEAIVAVTSVTYAPAVTNAPVTIYYDIGNGASTTRHKLIGCGGSVSYHENANQIGYFEFNMIGRYGTPAEATEITPNLTSFNDGLVYDDDNITTFTLGGFAAKVIDFEVDLGPNFQPHNIKGHNRIDFASRSVSGSMRVLAEELDTKNYFSLADPKGSAVTGALSQVKGSGAGNVETFSAPKLQVTDIQQNDYDGLVAYTMPFVLIPTAGDDEWSWAIT